MILSLFNEAEFVLKFFNVPFPADLFSVEVDGGKVTVTGAECEDDLESRFQRSFQLPEDVEERWFYPVMNPQCLTLTFARRSLKYSEREAGAQH